MPKKIICWVNENDESKIRNHKYDFILEFVKKFDDLPDNVFYIVSLKKASEIYNEFVSFMRARPESKFFFLDIGDEVLENEDYIIRDEPNTDGYMWVCGSLLHEIKELICSTNY
jgi:hypothetical protein